MRAPVVTATLALVLVAGAGCPDPDPFDIVITNGGDVTTYISAGEGTGILIGLSQQIRDEWQPLSPSLAWMCAPRCGAIGPVVCAELAAELGVVYALRPDDSTTRSFDGEWWYLDPNGSCARKATLAGPLQAELCHGPVALDANTGDEIVEPAESGVIDGGGGGASVQAPTCQSFEFDLEVSRQVELEIDEQ